ncbi:hypothetical protein V8C37DRAFT_388324 [Trichoderma ceciliae]
MSLGSVVQGASEEKNGDRVIADLWQDALRAYKGIVGFDLERKFDNIHAMIDQATDEMNNFRKFRHNEKKVDKLRTLLMTNLDYIDAGTQQLVSAASPAFPPAAAIGTAITYFLGACRLVSADYDTITIFLEDMKSFLQRILILEARLPQNKQYQACLMEVFTSFLTMCGFAHKFVELGRFKKWISNFFEGEDSELASARKNMDDKLSNLQNATEFAILGNTEEQQKMTLELQKNSDAHTAMLQEQLEVMNSIRDTTERMSSDIAELLKAIDRQGNKGKGDRQVESQTGQNKPPAAKRIRNILPQVEDESREYYILKETMVDGTCAWIFSEPQWAQWLNQNNDSRSILAIMGSAGFGKSHIGAAIYENLRERAENDSSKHTCTAHFYFREHSPNLSNFLLAMASIINQVVEQNSSLCALINAQWLNDEVNIKTRRWQDLVEKLLLPAFKKDSQNTLFVILDGIDELSALSDFKEFIQILHKEAANILIVFTSRPDVLPQISEATCITTIGVSMKKQAQDLKALIWKRIRSLGALRMFSRYVQQRIADRVEEVAPNMLYAEHILLQMNALGREGAVLRNLDTPLPVDLYGLYDNLLDECYRRTDTSHHEVVTNLLRWVAYSFRPLSLDELASLAKLWANDKTFQLDDITEPFAKFVRIGDPGADAEERARLQSQGGWGTAITDLERNDDSSHPSTIFNDGKLPIKFKERSLRSFFRDMPKQNKRQRWTPSQAYRQIFLDCVNIGRLSHSNSIEIVETIKSYAVQYLIDYWKNIKIEQHSVEEQAEAMEAVAATMLNKYQFATMVESHKAYYIKNFSDEIFHQMSRWAGFLNMAKSKMSEEAVQWWDEIATAPRKCLWHLSKAHVRQLFDAANLANANLSFNAFRNGFQASGMDHVLVKQAQTNFDSKAGDLKEPLKRNEAALGLEGLFEDVEIGASGYRVIASILLDCNDAESAEAVCQKAIYKTQETEEKVKVFELMARIHLRTDSEKAYKDITCCIEDINGDTVSPELRRQVFITKARIEVQLKNDDEAALSYSKAKIANPNMLTTGDVLEEEINIFSKRQDKTQYIKRLMSWSPLERLTWLTWDYGSGTASDRHSLLADVAVITGENEFIIQMYEESIKYLDNVQAGAPLRIDLAYFYLLACDDAQKVRQVTDEVLDSRSSGWRYAVTGDYPDYTLETAVELQSQAHYILFRDSDDPAVMNELLKAQQSLLTRPLALDVPPRSETYLFQRQLALSRMYMKMGPAIEFQRCLQGMIDTCIERLCDKVGWNDADSLSQLATALNDLSNVVNNGERLQRMARILVSARFSRLIPIPDESDANNEDLGNKKTDEGIDEASDSNDEAEGDLSQDEGDLGNDEDVEIYCCGVCSPTVKFSRWGSSVGYQCLTCYFCFLCQGCFDKLHDRADGETAPKHKKYCEKQFGHIKGPIEGWRGVKNGKVMLEGEDPVEFTEILRHIQDELCKEAWKDFWRK